MEEELKNEIEELNKRVATLEAYVTAKKIQQLSFPVDEVTKRIIEEIAA